MSERIRRARLYYRKWRWFERNSLPWNRLAIHREFMHHEAYVRWPVHGNVLQALRSGRMEIAKGVHLDHDVWISVLERGHLKLGRGVALNVGVFISVLDRVEIGEHTGIGNGSFISDGQRGFDGPPTPFMRQPIWSKGPTIIGSNVWIGVNCSIGSGVTIGDWSIIGAGSVVTRDIPPRSVAVGAPARVIRTLEFDPAPGSSAVSP